MKPPQYERLEMLGEAIRKATERLNAPIDHVKVEAEYVHCWAGSKEVTLSCHYDQGGQLDDHGNIIVCVGTGWWRAEVVSNQNSNRPKLIKRAVANLVRRLTA